MVILHFFYAVCQREQTVRLPELSTKVQGKKQISIHIQECWLYSCHQIWLIDKDCS